VHDSFCAYAGANPSIGTKNRNMSQYNHPLAALPCSVGCATPIQFDPTPFGNRGTWEQVVEVGPSVKGEFIYPLGQSGFNAGVPAGYTGNGVKQAVNTSSMQPLWRDWRFIPMLHVCEDVTLGGDEDGDTDGDGVVDAFEKWYYGKHHEQRQLRHRRRRRFTGDRVSLGQRSHGGRHRSKDGVADGDDVAPQDRLCVIGTLRQAEPQATQATPAKDKVSAKWWSPLNVCIGSDYQTACTVDADCGVAGVCRRIRVNPKLDSVRIVAATTRRHWTPTSRLGGAVVGEERRHEVLLQGQGRRRTARSRRSRCRSTRRRAHLALLQRKDMDVATLPSTQRRDVVRHVDRNALLHGETGPTARPGRAS
jgi:hypothetical protein